MTATVPAILKYLSNNQDFSLDQNVETPRRAKKRRLDHLSWEEKTQRKKLKNRVAAQTSRDRKKAKVEQMETALQQLFSQNETLVAEREALKFANQRLSRENAELQIRLQAPCLSCVQNRIPPSAERKGHTLSSGFEQTNGNGSVDGNVDLPSLPDLLDELDSDVDINSLEQLTQSLLQDIARDLQTAAEHTDNQESICNIKDSCGEMVGQTSEQLEPTRGAVLNDNQKSLEIDISEYLLLHHNYAAKPPSENKKKPKTTYTKRKLKPIKPKIHQNINKVVSDSIPVIITDNTGGSDVFYDDRMTCVTILAGDDFSSEKVDELNITGTTLSVPSPNVSVASPMSSSNSDFGYESLDSPLSSCEIDIWDASVSELFPSLM